MKNLVCAFLFVLGITGAATVAHTSVPLSQRSNMIVAAKSSAFPIPLCPPDDPNGCGMGGPKPSVTSR